MNSLKSSLVENSLLIFCLVSLCVPTIALQGLCTNNSGALQVETEAYFAGSLAVRRSFDGDVRESQ